MDLSDESVAHHLAGVSEMGLGTLPASCLPYAAVTMHRVADGPALAALPELRRQRRSAGRSHFSRRAPPPHPGPHECAGDRFRGIYREL